MKLPGDYSNKDEEDESSGDGSWHRSNTNQIVNKSLLDKDEERR